MQPFVKYESSLSMLKNQGTDESFYSGIDYCILPTGIVDSLSEWCRLNAANISLHSRGAMQDEPQEIFYVPLQNKKDREQLTSLIKFLSPSILGTLKAVVEKLDEDSFLDPKASRYLDDAMSLIDFRNALIRFREKYRKRTKNDAVLIIGGV
jgi:hypothetical protein